MRLLSKYFMLVCIVGLIINFSAGNISFNEALPKSPSKLSEKTDSTIYIASNNFTGYSGFGNSTHPYIIENKIINLTSSYTIGIFIENCDVYFIIRNCTVSRSASKAIFLSNTSFGTIRNNTVNQNYRGIAIYGGLNNIVEKNHLYHNVKAIEFSRVNISLIQHNFINDTNSRGIKLAKGTQNLIFNNTIQGTRGSYILEGGLVLEEADNNTILLNQINNNVGFGIYLDYSKDNNITLNTLHNNSDCILGYLCYNTITNNDCQNRTDESRKPGYLNWWWWWWLYLLIAAIFVSLYYVQRH